MADSWTSILKITYPHLAQLHLSNILLALVDRAYKNREAFQCGLLDFLEFYGGWATCPGSFSCDNCTVLFSTLCITQWNMIDWVKDSGCGLMHCVALLREHLFGWAHNALLLLCCVPVWASDAWRTSGWGILAESLFRLAIATWSLLHWSTSLPLCSSVPLAWNSHSTAVLPECPLMASVLSFCKAIKVHTYLGSFGAETPKPLQVWTTCPELRTLCRPKPSNLPGTLVSKGPDGQFTGLKGPLQESGIYPRAFGAEVADLFLSSYRRW